MPEAPLQFAPNEQTGQEALAGAAQEAINVYVDKVGAVRRRPGIATTSTLTSGLVDARGVIGLHASPTGLNLAVCGSATGPASLYRVTTSGSSALQSVLFMSDRPTFAETEAIVVMAGDSQVRKVNLASPYTVAVLGGTPPGGTTPASTQVIAQASRLLLLEPSVSGRVWYSAPAVGGATAGHEQWSAAVTSLGRSGFFAAEARTDKAVALRENTNEVFVFGQTSTQVFSPDAAFVYSPVSTKEYGCAAAGSVVRDEQSFAWLDHRRRFVYSDGRSFTSISDPIKGKLDAMSTVSDCFGFRVVLGPLDAFVWKFPTEGVTYCFQKGAGWSQWSGWDDATNNWAAISIGAAAVTADTNEHLVGTTGGYLGKLDNATSTDLGTRIPASITTGFQDQGTGRRKVCKSVRLNLRRGENPSPEVLCALQYRDDLGAWSEPLEVSLGATGDSDPVVDLRSLGVYRKRQWKFSFYGTEGITLASATEEFEVLGN